MNKPEHTVLYISHGAGPLPVLGDEGHVEMVENLKLLAREIPRPSAVLVVSAHWEEAVPTVTTAANPELYYDYYGFPPESYELRYPAPGDPDLAEAVRGALEGKGFSTRADAERGLDHGVFIPLTIMYPEADIPCVQLSLIKGLVPAEHLAMGEALAGLDRENLLIIGSGFSFHNMRAFFAQDTDETRAWNEAFEQWLIETCSAPSLDGEERKERLLGWESAPHARYCHPREEHLMPVHVCCGATNRPSAAHYRLNIIGKRASAYRW
jgi:aromatic ring-opening dioxygenase catalytic subunit (LigB family)